MIDSLLTIAIGIYATLAGFGKVRLSNNAAKNREFLDRFGTMMRVGGILLIIVGCSLALAKLFD